MRTTVLVLFCLLLSTSLCYFSMNNTSNKEIGSLVNHTWYDLLPQKVIQERINLLNLLGPHNGSSLHVTHAFQTSRGHLLKGRLNHY